MKPFFVALLFVVLCPLSAVAQQRRPDAPREPSDEMQVLRVNSTVVNTLFTVSDNKKRLITNLKQEDFRVYEDDQPQVITGFSSESNLPLSIGLLVDTSGSIRDKVLLEQEYATEFFYSTVHRGKDRAMVISFDSAPELVQDFTDDTELLAKAVRRIRAGGGTSMYDAVYYGITEKLAKEPEDRRKVLLLISDGDDNSSRLSMTETLDLAQKYNITIYCISTNSSTSTSREQERGDKILRKFSDDTGGKPFFPLNIKDMGEDFTEISEELRSQYTIGYRPSKPDDGTFRKIRIEVIGNKNFKTRHRTGYYSPRPSSSD